MPLRHVIAATAAAVAACATVFAMPAPSAGAATTARPFAANSAFNTALSSSVAVDWDSTWKVQRAAAGGLYSNLVEFGIPIFNASSTTPKYSISCSQEPAWGRCPFTGVQVPVPAGAKPHTGSDGAMVVVDATAGKVYEFWQATKNSAGKWSASWGSVTSLTGSGWGSTATGSGASRLAGVVRLDEVRAGRIDHALVLQSDRVCAGTFLAPATKTDGDSSRADCLPEGTRVQLDPKIDLTTLGLGRGELAVAQAAQRYGAFLVDRGGTGLSVSFELDPSATSSSTGATYVAAGLGWDYDDMADVPWGSLRIVRP